MFGRAPEVHSLANGHSFLENVNYNGRSSLRRKRLVMDTTFCAVAIWWPVGKWLTQNNVLWWAALCAVWWLYEVTRDGRDGKDRMFHWAVAVGKETDWRRRGLNIHLWCCRLKDIHYRQQWRRNIHACCARLAMLEEDSRQHFLAMDVIIV